MTTTPVGTAKTLTQLVARQIRIAMLDAETRQSQLARRIGKSEQWLSVRLRGQQPIDLNDLALIARGLGVTVHELLPDAETARSAQVEPTVRYVQMIERTARPSSGRPTDNRPSGKPRVDLTPAIIRTSRIPRPPQNKAA